MARRRYPAGLTQAQKKMMRRVELGSFKPSPRQQTRLDTLVRRRLLIKVGGWYKHAENLVVVWTYFVAEDRGAIRIGLTTSTRIEERLQATHPRPLKLLGRLKGDHIFEVERTCKRHYIGGGWYEAHADVLAWTKKKGFQRNVPTRS